MASPEVVERRLRIASFLFVAAAIILTFGSFVYSTHFMDSFQNSPSFQNLNQEQMISQVLALVFTERVVIRCLFLAVFFLQLGIIFLLYLLVSKTRRLEELV